MKKYFKIIICIMLIISCFNTVDVHAKNKYDLIANNVIQKIQTIENTKIELVDTKVLLDVENNPSYLLIITNNGYAISTIESGIIAEYNISTNNIPYSEAKSNEVLVYGGPLNYIIDNKENIESRLSQFSTDEIVELNNNFLSLNNDLQMKENTNSTLAVTASYTGISASRFSRYSSGKWINSSSNYPSSQGYSEGGICGSIASAILLAYYDDYITDSIVPASIRSKSSTSPGSLIEEMFNRIDKQNPSGTFPGDLYEGIHTFIYDYAYSLYLTYSPIKSDLTTFSKAKTVIDNDRPILIGLLSLYGSTYGNHWVVAYQYLDESGTANDMYKCVDLWGDHDANVNVSWSQGYVYLKK